MASLLPNAPNMHGAEPAGRLLGFFLVDGKLRHGEMEACEQQVKPGLQADCWAVPW